jgi:hypothetical protein
MNRITIKVLEDRCLYLNKLTHSPLDSHTKLEGKLISNEGHCHISQGFNGVSLYRYANNSGAIRNVLNIGNSTKRELYNLMNAYIKGIEDMKWSSN